MTASVVLNGSRSSTRVSDDTRARILEAARRLHYRPNGVARGLSCRRMNTIGVVAEVDGDDFNLYFLELLNGILQGAAMHEQSATVFSLVSWQGAEQNVLRSCDGRVDGMIFIGPNLSSSFLQALSRQTPIVTIHSQCEIPGVVNIDVDNQAGAYMLVKHLIDLGHRQIAHFAGEPDRRDTEGRLQGYLNALAEAGISSGEALIFQAGFSVEGGRRAAEQMIDRFGKDDLPTAVFCANDAIAYGSEEVLTDHKIQIPDHISVAGFDDLLLSLMIYPALTTIRQPFRKMGVRAVEALLAQIGAVSENDDRSYTAGTEVFTIDLVSRGSVGFPRVHAEQATFID